MVDLEWYRSFIAVYRFGTASGAAHALHLTQPGVSQHVAALEKALAGGPHIDEMVARGDCRAAHFSMGRLAERYADLYQRLLR